MSTRVLSFIALLNHVLGQNLSNISTSDKIDATGPSCDDAGGPNCKSGEVPPSGDVKDYMQLLRIREAYFNMKPRNEEMSYQCPLNPQATGQHPPWYAYQALRVGAPMVASPGSREFNTRVWRMAKTGQAQNPAYYGCVRQGGEFKARVRADMPENLRPYGELAEMNCSLRDIVIFKQNHTDEMGIRFDYGMCAVGHTRSKKHFELSVVAGIQKVPDEAVTGTDTQIFEFFNQVCSLDPCEPTGRRLSEEELLKEVLKMQAETARNEQTFFHEGETPYAAEKRRLGILDQLRGVFSGGSWIPTSTSGSSGIEMKPAPPGHFDFGADVLKNGWSASGGMGSSGGCLASNAEYARCLPTTEGCFEPFRMLTLLDRFHKTAMIKVPATKYDAMIGKFFKPRRCPGDLQKCPDGSYADRAPENNCHFRPCPKVVVTPFDLGNEGAEGAEETPELATIKSNKGTCKTTGSGVPCVFPFKYEFVTYNGCTDVDSEHLWCATEVDAQSNYVKKGLCNRFCPMASEPVEACPTDTGGTCSVFSQCDKSRGNTTCEYLKCMCAEGFCNQDGKCVPKAEYQALQTKVEGSSVLPEPALAVPSGRRMAEPKTTTPFFKAAAPFQGTYAEGTVKHADYNFPDFKVYKNEQQAQAACDNDQGCLGLWQGKWKKEEGSTEELRWALLKAGTRTWKKGSPTKEVLSVKARKGQVTTTQAPAPKVPKGSPCTTVAPAPPPPKGSPCGTVAPAAPPPPPPPPSPKPEIEVATVPPTPAPVPKGNPCAPITTTTTTMPHVPGKCFMDLVCVEIPDTGCNNDCQNHCMKLNEAKYSKPPIPDPHCCETATCCWAVELSIILAVLVWCLFTMYFMPRLVQYCAPERTQMKSNAKWTGEARLSAGDTYHNDEPDQEKTKVKPSEQISWPFLYFIFFILIPLILAIVCFGVGYVMLILYKNALNKALKIDPACPCDLWQYVTAIWLAASITQMFANIEDGRMPRTKVVTKYTTTATFEDDDDEATFLNAPITSSMNFMDSMIDGKK